MYDTVVCQFPTIQILEKPDGGSYQIAKT